MSQACCWPTIAGRVALSAKPWCRPILAKLALNLDCGLATLKSAEQASPRPPPTAAPCTAATTGSGPAKSLSASSYSTFAPPSAMRPALDRPVKSAPAQKCLPSEHSMIARAPVAAAHSYASASEAIRSASKKLSGGLRISTVAT